MTTTTTVLLYLAGATAAFLGYRYWSAEKEQYERQIKLMKYERGCNAGARYGSTDDKDNPTWRKADLDKRLASGDEEDRGWVTCYKAEVGVSGQARTAHRSDRSLIRLREAYSPSLV